MEPHELWVEFMFPEAYVDSMKGCSSGVGITAVPGGQPGKGLVRTTQEKILTLLREYPELTTEVLAGRIRHVGATKVGHWEVVDDG